MKTVAILLVAGNSTRFESKLSKQMFLLAGKPVFSYSLDVLSHSSEIDEVCVVTNKNCIDEINKCVSENKLVNVHTVLGGSTRQISVRNGLEYFKELDDNDLIIIHDGARPLIDEEIIKETVKAVKKFKAVTVSIPMEDTVSLRDSDLISEFVDRNQLVRIQTPQAFELGLIRQAHKNAKDDESTDDCSLVMALPHKVKLIQGSKKLTKLTSIEDVKYLEALLK